MTHTPDHADRAGELFAEHRRRIFQRTDRLFAGLMVAQWLAGIAAAFWLSPKTWAGTQNQTHPHIWAALLLGGIITSLPVALALLRPGYASTRYVIAVSQMLWSALLIHLTGGRIETHFHVFGSLAFLAFYRDWRVLVPATIVVAADHFLRGVYWPQSVFGVLNASSWRWLEHAGWVIFEDMFLVQACIQSAREMRDIANQRAELEAVNERIERTVSERTAELRQTAEGLRNSEARYRDIFRNASDVIYTHDLEGNFTSVNPASARLIGYSQEEMLAKNMEDVLTPASLQQGLDLIRRALDGADLGAYEFELTAKDGRQVLLEVRPQLVKEDEQPVAVHGIARDITERKRVEEALRQAKEAAEAANRAKSEFLANMSHEIRTPMNGIIGMTDLALGTELSADQRDYLHTVKASADALLVVVNDILDFSKIEAGKLDLELMEFDLRDCLEDAMRTLAVRAHEKDLELVCDLPTRVPEALIGDSGRLRQVIINLVGNAIKFTERGEVVLEVKVIDSPRHDLGVSSGAHPDADAWLQFTVRDTGIGIPPEKQQAIFNAFEQADGSTARRYGGTGLGLAISAQLVSLMDGDIWVESVFGAGSTFQFTARFGLAAGTGARALRIDPIDVRDLPVLIVDDNATNRRILVAMLKGWRMLPTAVLGGREALAEMRRAMAAGTPFRLMLLDCQMPEMDGFTLAEEIRSTPELAGLTIMMLSSAGHIGEVARCHQLGIARYLMKPVRQSELLEAILSALETPRDTPLRTEVAEHRTVPIAGDARRPDHAGRRPLRILLAEDNVVNQRIAARMLENRGHTVVVVGDGRAALTLWERERFDLILMDVQMPELDGLEATQVIRQREEESGAHIPIVAMTAHAMTGDRERCLASGMDRYISKPVDRKKLLEVVEGLVYLSADARAGRPSAELT